MLGEKGIIYNWNLIEVDRNGWRSGLRAPAAGLTAAGAQKSPELLTRCDSFIWKKVNFYVSLDVFLVPNWWGF
jgi:hypothetical protein